MIPPAEAADGSAKAAETGDAAGPAPPPASAAARIDWWALPDDRLLDQCEWDRYRASGPGGQKRNKTDSAVRLRHRPTGLIVTAVDSRSQHGNRARAVRRLRAALAFELRQPLAAAPPPEVLAAVAGGRLVLSPRQPAFLPVFAWVLDLIDARQGRMAEAAAELGVSTGNLVRFLQEEPDGWAAANRLRVAHGHKPLRPDA